MHSTAQSEDPDNEDFPETPVGPQWVSGVLGDDIMEGVDLDSLDADEDDEKGLEVDDDSGKDIAALMRKRLDERAAAATDMEGLKGGVDKGNGWVSFRLKGGDVLGVEGEEGGYGDEEDGLGLDADEEDGMDARIRWVFCCAFTCACVGCIWRACAKPFC